MAADVLSAIMFSPRGGSAHVVRALVAGLRELGLEVTLLAGSRGARGEPGNASSFYGDVRPVDFDPALASADVLRFAGPPGTAPMHPSFEDRPRAPDLPFASLDDLAYERQVEAWSRELARAGAAQAAVLYLHHLTPLNEAAARVAPQVPVIGHLHGTELLMLERIVSGPPAGWTCAERWARRMRLWAARCDRLLVSPAGVARAADLLQLEHARFVELPSGTDTDLFRPRSIDRHALWRRVLAERPRGSLPGQPAGSARYGPDDAARVASGVVVLYVGRFTAVKRLGCLIRAFARARARAGRCASLVLVGGHPGEWEGEHPATVAAREGEDGVFLAGWYDHDELPEVLAAGDAVALTSEHEQFGLVLLEAMACGLPAIATRSPGPATIIDDGATGWLVEADDERGLEQALCDAIDEEDERRRRGRRARVIVRERFSWPAIIGTLAELIAEVREQPPAAAAQSPEPVS